MASSPSPSTTVEAQAAPAAAAAPTESKCPFTSLLGKFLPASLTAAITGTMATTTTTATDGATGSSSGEGGCPIGYGRASASTQGAGEGGEGGGGTGGTCPLGFGSRSNTDTTTTTTGPSSSSSLPEMDLATLQAHAHLNLVSIKGVIYDVSAQAQKWAPLCGHDVSRVLAKGVEGNDLDLALVDQGLAGLNYTETVHLEKVLAAFQLTFPAVALLPPHEHQVLFASEVGEGGREEGREAGEEEDGVRLHALIEEEGSSLESIRLLLRPSIINYPCPRTGLTPLHKAIEVGREGGEGAEGEEGGREGGAALRLPLLRLLLEQGADREARALLYDGERGWELARRFGRGEEVEALLRGEGGKAGAGQA